jgi:hypothetical protein
LAGHTPMLAGIDHGFSFPLRHFRVHGLLPDWSSFLDDFHRPWPTDEGIYIDLVAIAFEAMAPRTWATPVGGG